MACDPRLYQHLHGIPHEERKRVWMLVHKAIADQAVETAARRKVEQESQPVVMPSPTTAAGTASEEDIADGEVPLVGLFAVSKSSSGTSSGVSASTGGHRDEDRLRSMARSQASGSVVPWCFWDAVNVVRSN